METFAMTQHTVNIASSCLSHHWLLHLTQHTNKWS